VLVHRVRAGQEVAEVAEADASATGRPIADHTE
jgi:hypothetical protein